VTERLHQRLIALLPGFDPICRCQNVFDVTLAPGPREDDRVVVAARFAAPRPFTVNLSVLDQRGRWLVDDTFCQDPSTSIYNDPVKPCGPG
jgi:hypothetical protein